MRALNEVLKKYPVILLVGISVVIVNQAEISSIFLGDETLRTHGLYSP